MDAVRIETAPEADALQRHAAAQLQDYLRQVFGVEASMDAGAQRAEGARILLGQVADPHIGRSCRSLPGLSSQGHLLRRVDERTLLLAGGSSAAVAWAVYELAERWGVRFLLHGDVLPPPRGPFHLPDLDLTLEPELPLRSWRQFNDLPTGPVLWTLAQQRAFIGQVFKLKFNGIYLCLWPQHPFVDFEVGGVRRRTATLLFGQRIPVDDDTTGRHLLPEDMAVLDNPEFAGAQTCEEKLHAGRRLLDGLLETARFYQLHTSLQLQSLEFPVEFQPLLQEPATGVQLGGLTCSERGDLTGPRHVALMEANLNAYLDQLGDRIDEIGLSIPEHPQAERHFEACWRALDADYGLEADHPLERLQALAEGNYLVPGGLERARREFRSSISMLHFFDRFFRRDTEVLGRARDLGVDIHLTLGGNSEALFPVLEKVLWPGAGVFTSLAYTSSRAVRAMHAMEHLDASRLPATLILTFQDDNVGSLPQVATESIHQLLSQARRLGWRGFFTRHWPIGDLDPVAAYAAKACWDASATPALAYHDHFGTVYGRDAAPDMQRAMRLLEDATVILDLDFLGLFFPVLGTMSRLLEADAPMPEGLFHIRALYEEVERILARAAGLVDGEAGRVEVAYWQGRLRFAVQALVAKDLLHQAGMARQAGDAAAARPLVRGAVDAARAGLEAMAGVARDESDANSVAAYHHFFVRQVEAAARDST